MIWMLALTAPLFYGCDKEAEDTAPEPIEDTGPVDHGVFVQVAAADTYSCGLRESGAVECWGDPLQDTGQMSPPEGLSFVKIAVGPYHACGIDSGGAMSCWGTPLVDYGQTYPPAALDFTDLAVGDFHTCGITSELTASCWGDDAFGQISDLPPDGFLQIHSRGNHICGTAADSSGLCWGQTGQIDYLDTTHKPPYGLYDFVAAGGSQFGCAAENNGELICWGDDQSGETAPPEGDLDITQLDTSDYHVCAVGVGGLVSCWGKDDVAQSTPPAGFSFTQVAVGSYHTCALTTEGSVECWGENYQGQSSPPLD